MDISSIIKNDFLEFDVETNLSEVIGKMRQFEKRSALVFKNKKYLGLIEKKNILHMNVDPTEIKVDKVVQKTTILDETNSISEAAARLFDDDVSHLPVSKDKVIIGVVSSLDVALAALQVSEISKLKLNQVKLIKPKEVNKDHPISYALEIMRVEHIDHVPIYDEGKLYGILSYRDIIRKSLNWSPHRDKASKYNASLHSKAASVETTPFPMISVGSFSTNDNLVTIEPTASVKEAILKMNDKRIKSLLVQDSEKLHGILSVRNILGKISSLEKIVRYVISYVGLNNCTLSEHQKCGEIATKN